MSFDNETGVLTETKGWLKFESLLPEDRVGTLNPETEMFEWQMPTKYINELYNGYIQVEFMV